MQERDSQLLSRVCRARACYRRRSAPVAARHRAGRLKQWLNLLRRRHPQAQLAYDAVRTINDPAGVEARLFGHAIG